MTERVEVGVIRRTVYQAHERVSGKARGEWMKVTAAEAKLIEKLRRLERRD